MIAKTHLLFLTLLLAGALAMASEKPTVDATPAKPAAIEAKAAAALNSRLSPEFIEKWKNASVQELIKGLNELASKAASGMQAQGDKRRILAEAMQSDKVTSPEIQELRSQVTQLENQLDDVRAALAAAIEKHPEIATKKAEMKKDEELIKTLKAQRDFLRKTLRTPRTAPAEE